jgi:putative addiction module killer protein
MITIRQLPEFASWLHGIRDVATRLRLAKRLDKAARGLLGDVKPVGEGVLEMREDFGPGWRMFKPALFVGVLLRPPIFAPWRAVLGRDGST